MSSMSRRLMKSPAVPLPWKMAGPDPLETTIPQPALSHGGPRFKRPALFEIGHQFLSTSSIPRDFFCLNGYRNFYLGIQEVNSVGLIWFLCIFAKLCPMFDSEDPSKIGWDWGDLTNGPNPSVSCDRAFWYSGFFRCPLTGSCNSPGRAEEGGAPVASKTWGEITSALSRVIIPVTHLQGHLSAYRGYNPIYNW